MTTGTPAPLRVPCPVADAGQWPIADHCAELTAPAHWQTIELISDLHLDPSHPQTAQAFVRYAAATRADAVLILGDLFEAWVGDDMRCQPFEAEMVAALRQLGQRCWLGIMVGNRDFLMGPELMAACHAHALPDPMVLNAFGLRRLITHGDAWCLDDQPYLAFRQQVRQAGWQNAFLQQPLEQRLATARHMRQASEARKREQSSPTEWADVDAGRALAWLAATHCQELIHGHTHRPGRSPLHDADATKAHTVRPGRYREVLSDWDVDAEHTPRAEVVRLSAEGLTRLPPLQAGQTASV